MSKNEANQLADKLIKFISDKVVQIYDWTDPRLNSNFKTYFVNILTEKVNYRPELDAEWRLGGKFRFGCKVHRFMSPESIYFSQYKEDATKRSIKYLEKCSREIQELFQRELLTIQKISSHNEI